MSWRDQGRNWLTHLVAWSLLLLVLVPRTGLWLWWEALDSRPYFICIAAGAVFGVVGWGAWARLTKPANRGCLPLLVCLFAPGWAMPVGLGSNVLFDRSPPAHHDTIFLGYGRWSKGPRRARFASWRKPGGEESFTCWLFRDDHCFEMPSGQRVVVITRAGAWGWPWIEDFAVRR